MQYDHGGEKYIKKIEVINGEREEIKSVRIHTKIFLQTAPLLNYTGMETYAVKSHRVDTYIWEYKFGGYELVTMNSKDLEIMEPIFLEKY